ncbi:MAG TPA: YaiI/YqxD family protein [Clostridiaceae bacterium]|nr:YaiI/YqxD family protein [Clostridiaceae bacterium]
MKIYIDADGCPVVKETIQLAKGHELAVVVVKNYAHELQDDYAEIVTVDISRDAADFYIANHMRRGDVLITQDYGLAAMVLSKGCPVLTQQGLLLTEHNILSFLDRRHIHQKMRKTQKIYTKTKKRTLEDDLRFKEALERVLSDGIHKI